ncbi:MAG: ABC transporter substrate-binding protein [Sedimentibacter sp.]
MKFTKIITLALASAMMFTGCSTKTSDVQTENNETTTSQEETVTEPVKEAKTELNIALSVDPDGLDPHRTTAASTFQITNNIYDTLVKVTPEGKLVSGLGEEWTVSEDGKAITFNLRKDVKFHNGREMNAEDVKYSFERLKGEESPRANDFKNITEINVVDDYTIEFVTENLNVTLLSNFAYPWTAIVPQEAVDTLKNKPVGTGAYKLEKWIPQQELTLTKNEEYFEEVNLETINFKMMPDATSQVAALKNGELDIIFVTGDKVSLFENNSQYNILENNTNAIQLMAMNLKNEYLANEKVRQAINMAVDKDSLIEIVWNGYGEKIGSHYPPMLKEYKDTTDVISYNPEKAKELLVEAGYKDGITIRMALPNSYPEYVSAGQVIADQLSKVGITCEINLVEWGTWLTDIYNGRNYDLTVVGHTGRLDPYVLLSRYNTESKENYFNYSNERVDEILTLVQKELDESKRIELYQEMQEILAEEVPALYIQSPKSLVVTSSDVEGFESYPIDIYELKNINFN